MEHNKEEIELFQILNTIKSTFKGWIVLLFKAIEFIQKKWIILLILVVVGVGFGYYKETKALPEKNIKALLRVNYDAVNYVYTSIELLNKKVKEKDNNFLKSIGIEPYSINSLELKPIIKIKQMVDQFDQNNRNIDVLLKNIEFDEDEVVLSETFTSAYKDHVLVITTNTNDKNIINNVLNYLNDNELIKNLKEVGIKHLKEEIESDKRSIAQLDKILDTYSQNQSMPTPVEQMFVVDKNFSVHLLIEKKVELLEELKFKEQDLIFAKEVVVPINSPELAKVNTGLLSNLKVLYPILLVFLFLFLAYCRYIYFRLKGIAYQE
ncbi:MAG: hypothetical protein QM499_07635 [Flavobacteriaceae bacterium]